MNDTLKEIKENINDYITTVNALLCFIALTTWENEQSGGNYYCSFGRTMTTSPYNSISANTDITPDEVLQLSGDIGFVIEAKISLPQNKDLWEDLERQLRKYDDDLIGWWTENDKINKSNSILLIEISRSEEFREYHEKLIQDGKYSSDNRIVGIEFSRADQFSNYIFFRTRWGHIDDSVLDKILRYGKKKDIQFAESKYGRIKFNDSEPEPEYLLTIMWQDIFTALHREVEYNKGLKCYPLNVDVEDITRELQRGYGSQALQKNCNIEPNAEREVEFPQISWVRSALDILEKLKVAKKNTQNNYAIYFNRLRTEDMVKYFSKYRKRKKEPPSEDQAQISLFSERDLKE